VRAVKEASSDGSVPVKKLEFKEREDRAVRRPISDGRVLLSGLPKMSRNDRAVRLNNSRGSVPDRPPERDRYCKLDKRATSVGRVPNGLSKARERS